ncbi:palmitoyltransferase ZDHHC22 isoform X1 [Suncus etruscus]|uniref:palmitoyltransferase ZDHHC22 isoform X1 n=1 Tax=Suncus etruscus TaxID=109475 RepID=UPI00210F917B|nr:palmitoyltransferase ZDHHC22 isoform X1 [Suncus etruscus]
MAGFGGCPASCLPNRLLAGPHSPAPQWEDGGCPLPPPRTPRYLPSPRAASRRGAEPATLQPPGGSEPKAGAALAGDRSAGRGAGVNVVAAWYEKALGEEIAGTVSVGTTGGAGLHRKHRPFRNVIQDAGPAAAERGGPRLLPVHLPGDLRAAALSLLAQHAPGPRSGAPLLACAAPRGPLPLPLHQRPGQLRPGHPELPGRPGRLPGGHRPQGPLPPTQHPLLQGVRQGHPETRPPLLLHRQLHWQQEHAQLRPVLPLHLAGLSLLHAGRRGLHLRGLVHLLRQPLGLPHPPSYLHQPVLRRSCPWF